MNYKRLLNEELSSYKYPNLVAEIIESGYTASTLADFMGIGAKKDGRYRKEDDPEVWGRINGTIEMCASHMIGLCKYYGADVLYLFSDTLQIINGKPAAYWKWYKENQRQERELNGLQALFRIYNTLHDKLYLTSYIQTIIDYIQSADDEIEAAQNLVKSLK